MRPCAAFYKGCPALVPFSGKYCEKHQHLDKAKEAARNAEPIRRMYRSARWYRFKAMILGRDPLCCDCQMYPSTDVHHIKKARHFQELFFTEDNVAGLCHECHSKRTARGE